MNLDILPFWGTILSTYYEFWHAALLVYSFFHILWIQTYGSFGILFFPPHIMNSDILLFWCTVFFPHAMNSDILFFFPRIMNFFGHTALMENCFFTYYEFGHTALLTYCFFFVEILWMQTYCYFSVLLISWTYCSFGILLFHMLWIRTYCFFHALWIFGHIVLLVYCFSHIMNSEILLFWTQHQISLDSAI